MRTDKIKIVTYLKKKNYLIKKETGISFTESSDYREILHKWPVEDCWRIWKIITKNKKNLVYGNTHPWCIYHKHENSCRKCRYGQKHGACKQRNSNYIKIDKIIKKKHNKTVEQFFAPQLLKIIDEINGDTNTFINTDNVYVFKIIMKDTKKEYTYIVYDQYICEYTKGKFIVPEKYNSAIKEISSLLGCGLSLFEDPPTHVYKHMEMGLQENIKIVVMV